MFAWRVTKYDPKNRDSKEIYLTDEWTSYLEKSFPLKLKITLSV